MTVGSAADVVGAVAEIFTWVGFGAGALVAGLALILYLADGTWLPASAVVESDEDGELVRWWDEDGDVNEAPLSAHDRAHLGTRDMVDIWYRRGYRNRMRLNAGSSAVRAFALLAAGLIVLGAIALITSWVILFIEG